MLYLLLETIKKPNEEIYELKKLVKSLLQDT